MGASGRPNAMPTEPKSMEKKAKTQGVPNFSPLENLAIARAALEVSKRGETKSSELDTAVGMAFGRHMQILCSPEAGDDVFDEIEKSGCEKWTLARCIEVSFGC